MDNNKQNFNENEGTQHTVERRTKPERNLGLWIGITAVAVVAVAVLIVIAVIAVLPVFGGDSAEIVADVTPKPAPSAAGSPSPSPSKRPAADTALDNGGNTSVPLPQLVVGGQGTNAQPVVYVQDDEVFMISGEEVISLGQADLLQDDVIEDSDYINGIFSKDNKYLFYLGGYNETTGQSRLMRVQTDGRSEPVCIAENVCAAICNESGEYVMYVTDSDQGAGTLWYQQIGKKAKQIETSVFTRLFGMSPDGQSLYYTKQIGQPSDENYTLVRQINGGEPQPIKEKLEIMFTDYISLHNNGMLLYDGFDFDLQKWLVHPNGEAVLLSEDTYADVYAFDDGSLVTVDKTGCYYVAPDAARQLLSEDCQNIIGLRYDPVSGMPYSHSFRIDEKRFLMIEPDQDNPGAFVLYDYEMGKDKVRIGWTDDEYPAVNADFTMVAFRQGVSLMLAEKTPDGWSEPKKIADHVDRAMFDDDCNYLYYFGEGFASYWYSPTLEKSGLIEKKTMNLFLFSNVPYVFTEEHVYRFDTAGRTVLLDNANAIQEVAGGVLISVSDSKSLGSAVLGSNGMDEYDIYYVSHTGNEPQLIAENITSILWENIFSGYMAHYPAVPSDVADAMQKFYEDALVYIDSFDNGTEIYADDLNYPIAEAHDLALTLFERIDISFDLQDVFLDYAMGFYCIEYALEADQTVETDEAASALEDGVESLRTAIEEYEAYLSNE